MITPTINITADNIRKHFLNKPIHVWNNNALRLQNVVPLTHIILLELNLQKYRDTFQTKEAVHFHHKLLNYYGSTTFVTLKPHVIISTNITGIKKHLIHYDHYIVNRFVIDYCRLVEPSPQNLLTTGLEIDRYIKKHLVQW